MMLGEHLGPWASCISDFLACKSFDLCAGRSDMTLRFYKTEQDWLEPPRWPSG